MATPEQSQYKDVHSGMLPSFIAVTLDMVEEHMASNEKSLEEKSKASTMKCMIISWNVVIYTYKYILTSK